MKSHWLMAVGFLAASWIAVAPARAQEVTKENIDGITNFHRLETVVACSGAIKPEVVPQIKKMGFVSIINLREPTENGANIEGEGAAAKAEGLRYYSIPFNATNPSTAAADKFVEAITHQWHRARIHSLRRRRARRHHVVHQAYGRGSLGRGRARKKKPRTWA